MSGCILTARAKAYLGGAKPSDIRERNEVIAGLYRLGHSQREISYRFGICQQTVSGICVKLGVALHDPVERNKRAAISRRIKWTPEMDAAVLKLRAAGMTFYDIAARVGVAHNKARLRYHTLAGTKPATYARRVSA